MKVLVYVEGPSDRFALEALFRPIIAAGQQRRIGLRFIPMEGKAALLKDVGRKAADYLSERPDDWIFALPDLYPMAVYSGTPHAHGSSADLSQLLMAQFQVRAKKVGVPASSTSHFRVHCLKYDLEALLLAVPDVLKQRLRTDDALHGHWRRPVEDQNDDKPPKRIVEALFDKYRRKPKYTDTSDALWILERASLDTVEAACPQCFGPLVKELRTLADGGTLS